jgi:hypothetical protein
MNHVRKLPVREQVFIESLKWFGFRITNQRKNLNLRRGYVVPSTGREDASGIDLWVKVPNDRTLYPIQITQRGIRIFRLLQNPSQEELITFSAKSNQRIVAKRAICERDGIVFVLVRDYLGFETNFTTARRDFKALFYCIRQAKRRS